MAEEEAEKEEWWEKAGSAMASRSFSYFGVGCNLLKNLPAAVEALHADSSYPKQAFDRLCVAEEDEEEQGGEAEQLVEGAVRWKGSLLYIPYLEDDDREPLTITFYSCPGECAGSWGKEIGHVYLYPLSPTRTHWGCHSYPVLSEDGDHVGNALIVCLPSIPRSDRSWKRKEEEEARLRGTKEGMFKFLGGVKNKLKAQLTMKRSKKVAMPMGATNLVEELRGFVRSGGKGGGGGKTGSGPATPPLTSNPVFRAPSHTGTPLTPPNHGRSETFSDACSLIPSSPSSPSMPPPLPATPPQPGTAPGGRQVTAPPLPGRAPSGKAMLRQPSGRSPKAQTLSRAEAELEKGEAGREGLTGFEPKRDVALLLPMLRNAQVRELLLERCVPEFGTQVVSKAAAKVLKVLLHETLMEALKTQDARSCREVLCGLAAFYTQLASKKDRDKEKVEERDKDKDGNKEKDKARRVTTFLLSAGDCQEWAAFHNRQLWEFVFLDLFNDEKARLHASGCKDRREEVDLGRDLLCCLVVLQRQLGLPWPQLQSFVASSCSVYKLGAQNVAILDKFIIHHQAAEDLLQVAPRAIDQEQRRSAAQATRLGRVGRASVTSTSSMGNGSGRGGNLREQGQEGREGGVSVPRHKKMGSGVFLARRGGGDDVLGLDMLAGERVVATVDMVIHLSVKPNIAGTLHLTTYQVALVAHVDSFNKDPNNKIFLAVPVGSIAHATFHSAHSELHLFCKDLRRLAFVLKGDKADCHSFFTQLKRRAFPKDVKKTFAFAHAHSFNQQNQMQSHLAGRGWKIYSPESEFRRQGIVPKGLARAAGDACSPDFQSKYLGKWELSDMNTSFDASPTYPSLMMLPLPDLLPPNALEEVLHFRKKARISALVYYYNDTRIMQDHLAYHHRPPVPVEQWAASTEAVMLRAAQPMAGVMMNRCPADEALLKLANVRCILDARPKRNAMANMAKGGGYENIAGYHDCRIEFLNIENIHCMRDSLNKVVKLCNPVNHDHYLSQLASATWLKHVRYVLVGSVKGASSLAEGKSILVHCSDGWDRTAQLTSLIQLMLEPHYRTFKGFAVLVEKEWLSFGHMFKKRLGVASKDHHDEQRSPIFSQFLDCVWQVLRQYPVSFEFTEEYLTFLMDHLHSNRFGTFLHNREAERAETGVRSRTFSIWGHPTARFVNPFYARNPNIIWVNTDMRALSLWHYYSRANPAPVQETVVARGVQLMEEEQVFVDKKAKWLQEQIRALKSQIASLETAQQDRFVKEMEAQARLSDSFNGSGRGSGAAPDTPDTSTELGQAAASASAASGGAATSQKVADPKAEANLPPQLPKTAPPPLPSNLPDLERLLSKSPVQRKKLSMRSNSPLSPSRRAQRPSSPQATLNLQSFSSSPPRFRSPTTLSMVLVGKPGTNADKHLERKKIPGNQAIDLLP